MTSASGHALRVGERYGDRSSWPEGLQWRLSEDGVELLLLYREPSAEEIDQVRTGRARFALLVGAHALILAHRFGDGPWADSPWQAARQTDVTAGLAERGPGEHLLVQVVLVDADTGVIKALRVTSWSPKFAKAVRDAIRAQLANGSTNAQGDQEIDAWYRRYPQTPALVRAADLTSGGT